MRAALSVLILVATATSTNHTTLHDGGSCVPAVLPKAKAPSWPIPHDVTVDATKLLGNITTARDQEMLYMIARELLATRPELVAVMLASPPRPPVLALNARGKLLVFRNRTVESEMFWSTVDSATTGWAPPFRDCTIVPGMWLHAFVVKSAFSAAVGVFLPVNINQCDDSLAELFGGRHRCDNDTTLCIPLMSMELYRDGYRCICRPGFFSPSANATWAGTDIDNTGYTDTHKCMACPIVCDGCEDGGVCLAKRDFLLKTIVLAIQLTFMGVTLILALTLFKNRKCKTIASAMWTVLETILLGIFLLYSTVVIRYFEPSVLYCLLEPWARELGFIICYGAIILKLYRHLIEFRTRKAHRWVVKDTDLLKYLFVMLISVLAYMAAYTAISLNFLQENYSLLTTGITTDGLHFHSCKPLWWDYVTELGEITILIFGIHLSFACRNASTQFQERQFLCVSICIELAVNILFYIIRAFYLPLLHPDHVLLAYFLRTQLTCTIVMFLIFMPKLWYHHKQARSLAQEYSCRLPVDAFKTDVNAHGPLTGNNSDVEVGEVTLADMSPDDIRAELKRLYMQLEILKNKTIRADNPHISKRRGGRKVAHRRFSLQKKGSREKALHANKQARSQRNVQEGETEASRTPEDSVCSNEGPSVVYNDMPSTTYSDLLVATTPRPQ
ncbi:smog [Carabus blaptoides fortunei]